MATRIIVLMRRVFPLFVLRRVAELGGGYKLILVGQFNWQVIRALFDRKLQPRSLGIGILFR